MLTTIALFVLAFSLDTLIGEPPNTLHPVAWFGRLIARLDRKYTESERGQRLVGVAIALFAPMLPAILAGSGVFALLAYSPFLGTVAAAVVLFASTSLRSLLELTRTVVDATDPTPDGESDALEPAREQIRGLVGRDTTDLSAAELRSAAVESVSENLADGLVAPLLPFALLAPISLPAAAAAAAWVKGVNTLDSMLGYPSKPHGTASALLDDLVMWIPARFAALTITIAGRDVLALGDARRWARAPPSPNSGWPMATLACVLSVRLTKPGAYDLNPHADLPTVEDGRRAVRVVATAGVVTIVAAIVLALAVTRALEGDVLEYDLLGSSSLRLAIDSFVLESVLEVIR